MPVLVIAAHGTRSSVGLETLARLARAVMQERRGLRVVLCFLDVLQPSLGEVLDALDGEDVVVVPVLLAAGYHVTTDIPRIVAGRASVRVAGHLGPDPLVLDAVAARLAEVSAGARTTLLAAVGSSRESARTEVRT